MAEIETPRNISEMGKENYRVFLQPVAAPSILGLFGFAGATFMLSAWMCGWYGDARTPYLIIPFAAIFGGLAQFLAGMWSYRARDGLATAVHGTWGSFYIGFGLLQVLFLARPDLVPQGLYFPELGYWFIVTAAITWLATLGAMARSKGLSAVLGLLSIGATAAAVGFLTGTGWVMVVAGYALLVSSFVACYDAAAQMLKECYGHEVLKIGLSRHTKEEPEIMTGFGEPGVIRGQK
jgi:succinate-acetate transporter protein